MTGTEEIDRQARAWEAQLRDQGLRSTDAYRIAQREAGWQSWALAEREAATSQAAAEAEARIAAARPEFEASQRAALAEASAPEPEAGS